MKRIPAGYILPSAAYTISKKQIVGHVPFDTPPRVGDVVFGEIARIGQHGTLENKSGRIHAVNDGSRAVFVFGNRYAPDYYESIVPEHATEQVDLVARSGVVGQVRLRNAAIKDPTRVRIIGRVVDRDGQPLNTLDHPLLPRRSDPPEDVEKRSPLILVVGSAMNAGKSAAAAACCLALSSAGRKVRASKITGTASLKDILHMNDAGASVFNDFTYLGYPSTYLASQQELEEIFITIDHRHANKPRRYWVVEIADGILQRETAMLLSSPLVQSRIHRLVFCTVDALGCIGGLQVLQDRYGLQPSAISGLVSGAPLAAAEVQEVSDIPIFNSIAPDLAALEEILR